jgi:HD-GYP domain-containing protein (c-di-GMP phosphodiesterase class II)
VGSAVTRAARDVESIDGDSAAARGGPESATIDPAGATVAALARALELHDYRRGTFGETAAHTERVTRLALRLARIVAPQLVEDPQLAHGFRLHDIGMMGVPSAILVKEGPLTPDELAEVREHPWLGERIVAPVESLSGLTRQVIACHHERWDGAGYPRGLAAGNIPLGARIFAVVDAFDAMTNEQPYRDAIAHQLALAEIRGKAGSQFDPAIAVTFVESWPEVEDGRGPAESGSP